MRRPAADPRPRRPVAAHDAAHDPSRGGPPAASRARFVALLLVATFACGGCVPLWPHRVDEPQATEGRITKDVCWGTDDELRVTRGPVEIGVRVVPRDLRRLVEVSIAVPRGHRVRLEGARVSLFDANDERRPVVRLGGVAPLQTPDAHLLPLSTTMQGDNFGEHVVDVGRRYWLYVPLDFDEPRWSIVLPALVVDGRVVELPVIRFVRRTRWRFFVPLRC